MTPSTETPTREGSREGQGGCVRCGGELPSRRARYCTRACQQRSYRLRHQTPTVDLTRVRNVLRRRNALVAHTVYESAVDVVSASSVSGDVRRAAYLLVRSVSVGHAQSAIRLFSSTTSSERG
jgi:hypothetical protein